MKSVLYSILFSVLILCAFSSKRRIEDIQFVCLKAHKATNACHFNFKVDGANYRYVDNGCKYSKKQDELIKKVQDGSFFLAKEWKIPCPEPKESKEGL